MVLLVVMGERWDGLMMANLLTAPQVNLGCPLSALRDTIAQNILVNGISSTEEDAPTCLYDVPAGVLAG